MFRPGDTPCLDTGSASPSFWVSSSAPPAYWPFSVCAQLAMKAQAPWRTYGYTFLPSEQPSTLASRPSSTTSRRAPPSPRLLICRKFSSASRWIRRDTSYSPSCCHHPFSNAQPPSRRPCNGGRRTSSATAISCRQWGITEMCCLTLNRQLKRQRPSTRWVECCSPWETRSISRVIVDNLQFEGYEVLAA